MRISTAALVGVAALSTTLATGCGFTAEDLARANNNRGDGYVVKAVVPDALNLPDGAPVRLGGVPIGRIMDVEVKDYQAVVSMRINNDIEVRSGAKVRLRYTTALGEMYVQVEPSSEGEALKDGAELPLNQAETAPSVEDALAAASMLINGGGLGSIQTIVEELNEAVEGRVPTTHRLIRRLSTTLTAVDNSEQSIDRILESLGSVSVTLNNREETINAALTDLRPAAKTLEENTDELVALLKEASKLGSTAKRIVNASRGDITSIVKELGPILDTVLANKDGVLAALDGITRGGPIVDQVIPNTYANLYVVAHFGTALLGGISTPGSGGGGGTGGLLDGGGLLGGGTGGLLGGTGGLLGGGDSGGGLLGGLL